MDNGRCTMTQIEERERGRERERNLTSKISDCMRACESCKLRMDATPLATLDGSRVPVHGTRSALLQ